MKERCRDQAGLSFCTVISIAGKNGAVFIRSDREGECTALELYLAKLSVKKTGRHSQTLKNFRADFSPCDSYHELQRRVAEEHT